MYYIIFIIIIMLMILFMIIMCVHVCMYVCMYFPRGSFCVINVCPSINKQCMVIHLMGIQLLRFQKVSDHKAFEKHFSPT